MPSPTLSVCIPTYNRATVLECCLTTLCQQIVKGGMQEQVQVCVSDNASPDVTPQVIAAARAAFPSVVFKCQRQTENLGFPRNARDVIGMADGQFACFCGDDDTFLENGLAMLLKATTLDYDIILFATDSGVGEYTIGANQNPLRIESPLVANRQLGLFHLSFIGNLLFRPALYLKYHRDEFFNSAYPHTCVLATALWFHPAIFLRQQPFAVGYDQRDWRPAQPLYAAIDLARVQNTCFLVRDALRSDIWLVYRQLVRSIPRMVLNQRLGLIRIREPSPFSATNAGNLLACYRRSWLFQAVALMLWVLAHALPLIVLRRLLKSARADG